MLEDLLERIDQSELELLAESIKESLSEHRSWVRKINVATLGRQPFFTCHFIAEDPHNLIRKHGCSNNLYPIDFEKQKINKQ